MTGVENVLIYWLGRHNLGPQGRGHFQQNYGLWKPPEQPAQGLFSGDSFSFLGTSFANIPRTFLISCEVHTRYLKTLKYSEQYFRDPLSSTNVKIWICFEHDTFAFSSYHFYYKNQTLNLPITQLVLCMLMKLLLFITVHNFIQFHFCITYTAVLRYSVQTGR